MNRIKSILLNSTFTSWIIYFCAISLSLEFIRFNCGYFTISFTSICFLISSIILGFLHKKTIIKNIKRNKLLITLLILFESMVLISCLVNFNTHAIGIMIEWFILPITTSIIIASALNKKEFYNNINNAIMLYIIIIIIISISSVLSSDLTYDGRLKSMWHSPNYLAMMITPMIPLIIWSTVTSIDRVARFISLLILFITFGILFATQSIFGLVSVFVGLFILLPFIFSIKYIKKYKKMFLSISFFIIIGIVLLFISRGSVFIQNIERSSLISRISIWNVSKNLIIDKSLTGYGLGTFQYNYLENQLFYKPYLEWAVPSTHNTYMMLWFTGGFFMLVIFMFISFYSILKSVKNFLILGNKKYIVFLTSATIIGIHGFVDTTVFGITISYIFWFLVMGMVITNTISK